MLVSQRLFDLGPAGKPSVDHLHHRKDFSIIVQAQIWDSTMHIQPLLAGGKKEGNWRNLDLLFKPVEECCSSTLGTVNFSPGWFEQAHDVCYHALPAPPPISHVFRVQTMT